MRQRLFRKGYAEDEIQEVIKKLKELGLLEDLNFARFWIAYRTNVNPRSRFYISMELKKKGISEQLIRRAFQEAGAWEDLELAYRLAKKKLRSLSNLSDPKAKRRRLYSYLERKGFSYQVARDVSEELLGGGLVED